jgi:hypothetical protein
MSESLDIKTFLGHYRKFYSISTWTQEKRDSHEKLTEFLSGNVHVEISSSRDSSSTKVHIQNGFTIFKVSEKQLGKMKPYRGLWVLMYCVRREKFKHFLKVFPLNKGIQKDESLSLKKEFKYNYVDIVK